VCAASPVSKVHKRKTTVSGDCRLFPNYSEQRSMDEDLVELDEETGDMHLYSALSCTSYLFQTTQELCTKILSPAKNLCYPLFTMTSQMSSDFACSTQETLSIAVWALVWLDLRNGEHEPYSALLLHPYSSTRRKHLPQKTNLKCSMFATGFFV
jgi:hypothetical protein